MSIQLAILGILSWKPSTGYELKKIFEDSDFMHWSGNNNQIYKALLSMEKEDLVTCKVVHQDGGPSKKIYAITEEGLRELKGWLMSPPDAPEIKKAFLVQFAWSDLLNNQELSEMLSRYENEIKLQLIMQKEKCRRGFYSPSRNARETLIWQQISENIIAGCNNELKWVDETRRKLFENEVREGKNEMNYHIREAEGKKYIELVSVEEPFNRAEHVLDLIALCLEHDIKVLMLHRAVFSEDFFRLETTLAGNMIQKFINYRIKAAAIVPSEAMGKGRFKEMAAEMNKGSHFRLYERKEDAEKWLLY